MKTCKKLNAIRFRNPFGSRFDDISVGELLRTGERIFFNTVMVKQREIILIENKHLTLNSPLLRQFLSF